MKERLDFIESRLTRLEKMMYFLMVLAFPSAIDTVAKLLI